MAEIETRGFRAGYKIHGPNNARKRQMVQERVDELLEAGLCDPIQVLLEIATGAKLNADGTMTPFIKQPPEIARVAAAAEVCSYLYPKRKAIEITGHEGQPIMFAVQADLSELPEMPTDVEMLAGKPVKTLVGDIMSVEPSASIKRS